MTFNCPIDLPKAVLLKQPSDFELVFVFPSSLLVLASWVAKPQAISLQNGVNLIFKTRDAGPLTSWHVPDLSTNPDRR